ncbi:hypothetical protein TNCV_3940541 [Trichonephila clavipes]|uniref:Uncharacterized protein n=1 Tax=Trichonephila clavipes TaxID=2585209 RepID=A0A8X7B8Q7_TRICX|nr:hypothetical protein TNCV_3940541 [Trichonephila clavipes]
MDSEKAYIWAEEEVGAQVYVREPTDVFTGWLFDTLSTRYVTTEAGCVQEQANLCPPKPYGTGVQLTAQHRDRRIKSHLILFTEESRLCRRIWWRPRENYEPMTSVTLVSMALVWSGIMLDNRMSMVHIDGRLTVDRYVTQVMEPVVLPLLQGASNTVFQQNSAKPHVVQ